MSRSKILLVLLPIAAVIYFNLSPSPIATEYPQASQVESRSIETATFAGGCFWCMEPPFEKLAGVVDVQSGYTGGKTANPTYEDVSSGTTGHVEAIQISYDPAVVTYADLLEVFWRNVDPTDSEGQFVDQGSSYITTIFAHNKEQRQAANASKSELEKSGRFSRPIVTPVRSATAFFCRVCSALMNSFQTSVVDLINRPVHSLPDTHLVISCLMQ